MDGRGGSSTYTEHVSWTLGAEDIEVNHRQLLPSENCNSFIYSKNALSIYHGPDTMLIIRVITVTKSKFHSPEACFLMHMVCMALT